MQERCSECIPFLSIAQIVTALHLKLTIDYLRKLASNNNKMVCNMHHSFLRGIFESLFSEVGLIVGDNILQGCDSCTYLAKLSIV